MISKVYKVLLSLSLVLYPIIFFIGLKYYDFSKVSISLVVLVFLKLFIPAKYNLLGPYLNYALVLVVGFNLLGYFLQEESLVKLYPVIMNISLLLVFALSLYNKKPIIQDFARRFEKRELQPKELNYTKNVTYYWTIFFFINALVSAYTVYFASTDTWVLYNGLISYILIGVSFAVEYLIRISFKKKWKIT